jgi:hypothetical protein
VKGSKRTRVFVILFFILSAAIFGGRRAYVMIHADRSYPVINVPSESIMIPADFLSRSGKVDYNTPGVYEITYKYTDSDIDISNFSRLYVVVY